MNKKNKCLDLRSSGNSKNEFKVKDGLKLSEKKIRIDFFNHESRKTTEYKYLKDNDFSNSAKINLEFIPNLSEGIENDKEIIEYSLTNLKPGSKTEWNNLIKEAYGNYIIDNVLIDGEKNTVGNIQYEIRKGDNGKISLELWKEGDDRGNSIRIKNDKIEINAEFYLIEKITDKELISYNSAEEKKPFLTNKTIILLSIVAIFLCLIFFFRKKIWKWIKGETKQEKKVESQLDIF